MMQPQPYQLGPPLNVWDLALHQVAGYSQVHFMDVLHDHLTVLIGRVEADPSLLQPPPAPERAIRLPAINIYGGTVNVAQTVSGNVSQSTAVQSEIDGVRQLLAQLESAIRDVQAPEEERENFLEPVEQFSSELGKSRPLISRLARSWGAIQAFAAIEGAWQGWERVQRISMELGPKAHDLIQALAKAAGQA
jgi:hypothetical protein